VTTHNSLFDEQIGFLMWDTTRKISREFATLIGKYQINSGLVPFLRGLYQQDGLTQRQLADLVQMRASTTLAALRELERLKLIRRSNSRHDGRKNHVYLTERGRALCAKIVPEAVKFNQRLLRGIRVDEQKMLRGLLRRMRDNMQPIS
jgi:DNA-binding MarR family transcriptional regulator